MQGAKNGAGRCREQKAVRAKAVGAKAVQLATDRDMLPRRVTLYMYASYVYTLYV